MSHFEDTKQNHKHNNEYNDYQVIEKIEIVPNIYKFKVYAPKIAKKAKAGQFILVMSHETAERIPLTLSDWDDEKGTISFFVQEVGLSTTKIVFLHENDQFLSIVGPLGKPAYIKNFGTVILGGGCYGIGAILPIVKELKKLGNTVLTIIEGRSSYLLYLEKELKKYSDEIIMGTKDGSTGIKAYISDIIEELLESGKKVDHIKVIGCVVTMMRAAKVTKRHNIETMVTVSTIMIDGTGMCGGCRLKYDGESAFACVDGPEFDAHKIDWDDLLNRKQSFIKEEMLAFQNFSPECRDLEEKYSIDKSKGEK